MKKTIIALGLIASFASVSGFAESTEAEVKTAAKNVKNKAKEKLRAADDAACETVNGKLKCLPKEAKHKLQNLKDKAE